MVSPIALADIQDGHPCLWGAIETTAAAPLVTARHARLIPTRPTGLEVGAKWWLARYQGAVDQDQRPIAACTDQRGIRQIYPLRPEYCQAPSRRGGREVSLKKERDLVLYGGSIFNHFGHLVLDLTRLYQLLPLFRRSKVGFWFHYPALERNGAIANALVLEWFECLGIRERVRLVQREINCNHLITAEVLYRDRGFVSIDFPAVARQALHPALQERLLRRQRRDGRIAYLSRCGLGGGTTRFEGEDEVLKALESCSRIDVIQPELLSIEAKLNLYRDYAMVVGFAQACMNMKHFIPYGSTDELAPQLMFVAGPQSLSSNWVNLDRAAGFGDLVLDCSLPNSGIENGQQPSASNSESVNFQRTTRFDVELVIETLLALDRR